MVKKKKNFSIVSKFGLLLLLVASLSANAFLYQKNQQLDQASLYRVKEVYDGDTFSLTNNQSIRLSNIEAPELEFCGGQEAKQALSDLVLNKNLKLEIINHDQYGRLVALVYVDKILVNQQMVKQGLARYDGSPSSQREKIKRAYDLALRNKRGIFGPPCRAEQPEDPKCLIKGNISRKVGAEKTYHFSGCSEYDRTMVEKDLGEQWFCSEKEAQQAGYKKAANCLGKKFTN
ncbi:MAG: thermonuclease family protein [Patescibacteria group bacterium]